MRVSPKRFMYKQLNKTLTKKAEKHYQLKGLKCKSILLEGFHQKDILLIKVFFESGLEHSEKMPLSENKDTLDIFLGQIKKIVKGFEQEKYSRLFIDMKGYVEKIDLMYLNGEKETKKFSLTQGY